MSVHAPGPVGCGLTLHRGLGDGAVQGVAASNALMSTTLYRLRV